MNLKSLKNKSDSKIAKKLHREVLNRLKNYMKTSNDKYLSMPRWVSGLFETYHITSTHIDIVNELIKEIGYEIYEDYHCKYYTDCYTEKEIITIGELEE